MHLIVCFIELSGDHRDLHVLTHSFPTRRSSDLWDAGRSRRGAREDARLVCGGPPEGLARRITSWLRREALRVLSEETAFSACRAGVIVSQVTVGATRGRWGSCEAPGALHSTWQLILSPDPARPRTLTSEAGPDGQGCVRKCTS